MPFMTTFRAALPLMLAAVLCAVPAAIAEDWAVLLGPDAAVHAGFQAAIEDLNAAGVPVGIRFTPVTALSAGAGNVVVVGDAARNPAGAALLPPGAAAPAHPEG